MRAGVDQLRRSLGKFKNGDAWVKHFKLVELQRLALQSSDAGGNDLQPEFAKFLRQFESVSGQEKFRKVCALAGFERVNAELTRRVAAQHVAGGIPGDTRAVGEHT